MNQCEFHPIIQSAKMKDTRTRTNFLRYILSFAVMNCHIVHIARYFGKPTFRTNYSKTIYQSYQPLFNPNPSPKLQNPSSSGTTLPFSPDTESLSSDFTKHFLFTSHEDWVDVIGVEPTLKTETTTEGNTMIWIQDISRNQIHYRIHDLSEC